VSFRLVRISRRWYQIEGTDLQVLRLRPSEWHAYSTQPQLMAWIRGHGLPNMRFARRRDLLRVLEALLVSDPPPQSAAHPARLRLAGPGAYATPDGRYRVQRAPDGHEHRWILIRPRGRQQNALTLRHAALLISSLLSIEAHVQENARINPRALPS